MHPVLFKFGAITIYTYGFCVALAMVFASLFAYHLARRLHVPVSTASDFLFIALVFGILGSRLFYVVQHWTDYQSNLGAVVRLQEGGLVWYGGFLAAVIAGLLYAHVKKLPKLFWADFFSPIIALAHAIGRVGCFMNGCCYGISGHPVQLYEAFLLLCLSLFLTVRLLKGPKTGVVFYQYLIGYGALRFGIEFFRGDQTLAGMLSIPQWMSLGMILAGFILKRMVKR